MDRIKRRIEYALANNWSTDNRKIQVSVSGHRVKLHGIVDSDYQKDEAKRLAWNASEVWSIENELVVDFLNDQTSEILFRPLNLI